MGQDQKATESTQMLIQGESLSDMLLTRTSQLVTQTLILQEPFDRGGHGPDIP